MGLLTMLIGPRGGGKTTAATWFIQDSKENYPDVVRISNVPIEGSIYVPQILKFLAIKLIVEGATIPFEESEDGTVKGFPVKEQRTAMLVIIDEAAISGLESRGSGFYSLDTYLLALSRKLHVDIILVSQLMSMIDKRGQWLADFYWLCKSYKDAATDEIIYFEYKIYNEDFKRTRRYTLSGEDARDALFGKFDSDDIPNYERLKHDFTKAYQITDADLQTYKEIADFKKYRERLDARFKELMQKRDDWLSHRWVPFWELVG